MDLKRIFANAIARRLAYVLVAAVCAVVATLLGSGDAWAQSAPAYTCISNGADGVCNREDAYNECMAHAAYHTSRFGRPAHCDSVAVPQRQYTCYGQNAAGNFVVCSPNFSFRWIAAECPNDGVWVEDAKQCDTACADREPLVDRAQRNSLVICHRGCSYSATASGGDAFSFTFGSYSAGEEWNTTGARCDVQDTSESWDPNKETCRSIPGAGFNECIEPDGTHCVTGAKGTRMCWQVGETGERMPTSGLEGATKGPANSDPPPPKNMEQPEKTGSTTTTIHGNTTTTNTFNGGGNTGGQNNTGKGGTGNGKGEGEGEEDKGSVSGGQSCDAAPVCTGDPIMCAINEGTWRARCDGSEGLSGLAGEFDAVAGDQDGDADMSGLEEANNPALWQQIRDLNEEPLDSSGFAGGGNCPALPAFSVGPSSFTINLSPMCELLANVSGLLLGFAYFVAAKIIAGVK